MRPNTPQHPELLEQILQSITASLKQHLKPTDPIPQIANTVFNNLVEQIGGIQIYLPRGDALKKYKRNQQITQDANTMTPPEIAKKYHLSDKQVWKILRTHKQAVEDSPASKGARVIL